MQVKKITRGIIMARTLFTARLAAHFVGTFTVIPPTQMAAALSRSHKQLYKDAGYDFTRRLTISGQIGGTHQRQ